MSEANRDAVNIAPSFDERVRVLARQLQIGLGWVATHVVLHPDDLSGLEIAGGLPVRRDIDCKRGEFHVRPDVPDA